MDNQLYHLIGDETATTRPIRIRKRKIKKYSVLLLTIISIVGLGYYFTDTLFKHQKSKDIPLLFIRGESRKDKYGVELNKHILDGIYCVGFDNDANKTIEEWSLYTPPCPNLHPAHYPDSILNPDCENESLQIINFFKDGGTDVPFSIHLHEIKNQLKDWEKWEKKNEPNPKYKNMKVPDLLSDEYHPFDYGYTGEDTSSISDDVYYSNVINSRMDEVPDPRRRRLFSFILFNTEFDLLDVYLSEYYDILDYIVIYEANTTFTGNPKPLYFTRALLETDRYDRFKDKLIPYPVQITIDEDNGRGKAFPREHIARRMLVTDGLKAVHARHGDIFMHGDLDEVMKPHVLTRLKKCGGWEHLQAGIGGGPKSFKDESVETYFLNDTMNVEVNGFGFYQVDYERESSIGGNALFYKYSFESTENPNIGTIFHPNVALFDARRSLGQLVDRTNKPVKRREYTDPLLDPNFDPYQGYSYTDNTNDHLTGKGYPLEFFRFSTSYDLKRFYNSQWTALWSAAWHMSSFLPTMDHLYDKIKSYSHYKEIVGESTSEEQAKGKIKKIIEEALKENKHIMGNQEKFITVQPILPKSYKEGYNYNFSYKYWKEIEKYNSTKPEYQEYIKMFNREVPHQVWQNPICYSYMLDRSYGISKKLWYEVVPKDQWKTVRLEELDADTIDELTPPIVTEDYKKEMLEAYAKENQSNSN